MGGKAFAHHNPPLATPRLGSALYNRLRDEYINQLSRRFQYVASPIPAPGKSSHGDIDILVTSLYKDYTVSLVKGSPEKHHDPTKEAIIELLSPTCLITDASETMNLAMPHPILPNSYVQLDVDVVSSLQRWQWLLFIHSYGDTFNLIGTSLHKVGLVGTDKGLFARDAEMEVHDGKKSRIFLTDDPHSFLEFLHLDPRNWLPAPGSKSYSPAHPFATSTDLFRAIYHMRYFNAHHFSTSDLRGSERRHLRRREHYTAFVDEFLPAMLVEEKASMSKSQNKIPSRKQVFHEALTYWDKEDEWRRIKTTWEQERIALLSKQAIRHERKSALAEEERYFTAWMAWSRLN